MENRNGGTWEDHTIMETNTWEKTGEEKTIKRCSEYILKSVNLLFGKWRNSAYSVPLPGILCNCNTNGLLVTIPNKMNHDLYDRNNKRRRK